MNETVNKSLKKLQNQCMGETQISVRACETNRSYLIQPNMKKTISTIETGQPWYYEELFDKQFRVSSQAIFQVNKSKNITDNMGIIDYFNKYEAFCFDLSPDSVLKGEINFKYN